MLYKVIKRCLYQGSKRVPWEESGSIWSKEIQWSR